MVKNKQGNITMTKEQEDEIRQEQKRVFDWMFKVQEERLKQRGYSCDDNGQRTLVIDLSVNKQKGYGNKSNPYKT